MAVIIAVDRLREGIAQFSIAFLQKFGSPVQPLFSYLDVMKDITDVLEEFIRSTSGLRIVANAFIVFPQKYLAQFENVLFKICGDAKRLEIPWICDVLKPLVSELTIFARYILLRFYVQDYRISVEEQKCFYGDEWWQRSDSGSNALNVSVTRMFCTGTSVGHFKCTSTGMDTSIGMYIPGERPSNIP